MHEGAEKYGTIKEVFKKCKVHKYMFIDWFQKYLLSNWLAACLINHEGKNVDNWILLKVNGFYLFFLLFQLSLKILEDIWI